MDTVQSLAFDDAFCQARREREIKAIASWQQPTKGSYAAFALELDDVVTGVSTELALNVLPSRQPHLVVSDFNLNYTALAQAPHQLTGSCQVNDQQLQFSLQTDIQHNSETDQIDFTEPTIMVTNDKTKAECQLQPDEMSHLLLLLLLRGADQTDFDSRQRVENFLDDLGSDQGWQQLSTIIGNLGAVYGASHQTSWALFSDHTDSFVSCLTEEETPDSQYISHQVQAQKPDTEKYFDDQLGLDIQSRMDFRHHGTASSSEQAYTAVTPHVGTAWFIKEAMDQKTNAYLDPTKQVYDAHSPLTDEVIGYGDVCRSFLCLLQSCRAVEEL